MACGKVAYRSPGAKANSTAGRIARFRATLTIGGLAMTREVEMPAGWGEDRITEFLDQARHNEIATFANKPREYGRLRDIESEIHRLIDNLHNAPAFHAGLFVLLAHSSFLGAIRLVMSGHVTETYPLFRQCLEAALYALYVAQDEEKMRVWLCRNDSEVAQAEVRKTFSIGNVRSELERRDPKLGAIAKELYDRCILLGAHPNVGVLTNMEIIDTENSLTWKLNYLHCDGAPMNCAMRTAAQVGLLALETCCLVYPQRAAILGIRDRMQQLRKGL